MTDLDTIRERINSPANDGECEHGFWHTECTNAKCWERDIRLVLDAVARLAEALRYERRVNGITEVGLEALRQHDAAKEAERE